MNKNLYDESTIKTLDWKDHIRSRPGMYIGKIGDGTSSDDGIYVLIKEIVDNCIDEYVMGFGKTVEININKQQILIRDFGRGIPLGKLRHAVSKINTGAKYDSKVFKKSVGLNGVGTKAVNALSEKFIARSFRDGEYREVRFSMGNLVKETDNLQTEERNGTEISFLPDEKIFKNFNYKQNFIIDRIKTYTYLNAGLIIKFDGQKFKSNSGLLDLLKESDTNIQFRYPIVHFKSDDFEIAFTHGSQYGEDYYSYVNGQHTTQGGTHLSAFKESLVRTLREFYKKDFEPIDVRASIVAAVSIKIQDPVFESQTKTKLGSNEISPDGETIRVFINRYIKKKLDDFLHKNPDTSQKLLDRILSSQKERKEISAIKKIAKKTSKKADLHNKKLRDCKVHLNDMRRDASIRKKSMIFITEGDSASGSITKIRDPQTQAVFSLRGKPLNSFGLSRKIVYQNEEFNLLQHALNIESGIENLRYNKIIIATDADVDGMHIRLLLLTFFLQFFNKVVKNNHLYILETPLFRVRNKKETFYCYDEEEKDSAIKKLGKSSIEITRFKGLGEINPDEFKLFISKNIRLKPVEVSQNSSIDEILTYYMGKNTQDRQEYIINNLIDYGVVV